MKCYQVGRLHKIRISGLTLALTVFTLALTACGLIKKDDTNAYQTLWRFQSQYIRIEPSEQSASNSSSNDHPVTLAAAQIRTMLAAIQAQLPGKSSFITGRKSVEVFSEDDLEDLGEVLSQGLARAGPDQDIVIFKAGYHRTGAASLPEKRGSAARVFYRDGHLNLIFGELLAPYSETADPRLDPVQQGSRVKPATFQAEIVTTPVVELLDGRPDWVVLNQQALDSPGDTEERTAAPVATATTEGAEQQALRRRVDKLEKQLEVERQQQEPEVIAPAPSVQNSEVSNDKSLEVTAETRLVMLKHLLERGLIPEEVYRERVEKILDEEL